MVSEAVMMLLLVFAVVARLLLANGSGCGAAEAHACGHLEALGLAAAARKAEQQVGCVNSTNGPAD